MRNLSVADHLGAIEKEIEIEMRRTGQPHFAPGGMGDATLGETETERGTVCGEVAGEWAERTDSDPLQMISGAT